MPPLEAAGHFLMTNAEKGPALRSEPLPGVCDHTREGTGKEDIMAIFEGSLMIETSNIKKVTRYPYRTVRVSPFLIFDVSSEEEDRQEHLEFLRQLNEKAGVIDDNHVVYGIEMTGGEKLYLGHDDDHITIGLSIKKKIL